MIVVKNARFITDNKTVKCTMDYYVLLNGVPENSPRIAIGEARCAPEDKFNFKVGMDLAYDRAYAKAVEVAKQMNRPDMRFVKRFSRFSGVFVLKPPGKSCIITSIGETMRTPQAALYQGRVSVWQTRIF